MAAASTPAQDTGRGLLESWLTMLGWQVEIECDGEIHVGVARHIADDGDCVVVGARAHSRSEAIWQLFEGAVQKLGTDDIARGILSPPRRRRTPAVAA